MHLRRSIVIVVLASAGLASGCAGAPSRPNLRYAERAQRDYAAAMDSLNSGDFLEAEEKFRALRRQFGLSNWGWLAELRLADLEFRKENWAQAIQGYRSFVRYHPNHAEVPYANFMIAKCYFSEIPNEWFLVPESWQRDQSSARDAEEHLQRFLSDYADSQYASEGRELLRRTRELLARAEIHVAEFYLSHNRYEAAISRFQAVIDSFPGSGLEPEALLRIGEIYLQMGRRSDARAAFDTIVTRFPRSSYAIPARRYLQFIGPMPARPGGAVSGLSPQGAVTSATPRTGG
jgi:outer membrane protein assembly factor BamD